jgi:hypothetical protein
VENRQAVGSDEQDGTNGDEQDWVDEIDAQGDEGCLDVEEQLLWLHMVIRPGKSMLLQRSSSGLGYDHGGAMRGIELYTKIGIITIS